MKITVKETKVICSNPTNPLHAYFAWPTVARLQDGRLAMTASGFRKKHICPFGKAVISFSDDEGKTWSRPTVVIDTPLDDRDAGILPFGKNSVTVTSFNNTVRMQRRSNAAAGDPYINAYLDMLDEEAVEEKYIGSNFVVSHDGGKTFGEIKRVPITSPHGPALLQDGSILYIGRTFSKDNVIMENDRVEAYKIDPDGGYSFLGAIENIEPDVLSCEPHTLVLANGKIIVHIRVHSRKKPIFTIYQSESYDGGKTFTKPHQLLSDKGGAPAHLLALSDGTIISAYGYRNAPYGIKMMYSTDDGETWSTGHDISTSDAGEDMGYPSSVELKNGDILTVFYAKESADAPAVIMQTIWNFEK